MDFSDQGTVMGLGCTILSTGAAVAVIVCAIKGTLGDVISRIDRFFS